MLSGILARTQHGLARSRADLSAAERCCQDGLRRKLLNDALIFLAALEHGSILVSANAIDMNLLLKLRPDATVLLFQPVSSG